MQSQGTLSRLPQGWTLTLWIAALLTLMCAAIVTLTPGVEGWRLAIRATARSSLLLFGLAFTAAALVRLWPSDATRWLRRNRRYLGVAFAASHALHLAAIIQFAKADPAAFDAASDPRTRFIGIIAYVFVALMALTSFDAAVNVLGRRAWGLLHTIGAYYIWLVFLLSHLKRTPGQPLYWTGATLVLAMLALRLVAWRRTAAQAALETRVT